MLGKSREDEASLVDLGVVVSAELDFLLGGPGAEGNLDVRVGVLAADHEADLTRGVGRDGGVGIFSNGEDLLAVLLELGDQGKVKPLVLSCQGSLAICNKDRANSAKQNTTRRRKGMFLHVNHRKGRAVRQNGMNSTTR